MNMNLGWSLAVEKLLRHGSAREGQVIRVIIAEMGRIASHLVGMGAYGLDLGTFSPFLYAFREREKILDLFEEVCGARLTYSYITPGGVTHDLPDEITIPPGLAQLTGRSPNTVMTWMAACRLFLDWMGPRIQEYHTLLTRNAIFIKRTAGIGILPREMAISYGCTGPVLRGSGVNHDLRRDGEPIYTQMYQGYHFNIPVAPFKEAPNEVVLGDNWCRFYVRMRRSPNPSSWFGRRWTSIRPLRVLTRCHSSSARSCPPMRHTSKRNVRAGKWGSISWEMVTPNRPAPRRVPASATVGLWPVMRRGADRRRASHRGLAGHRNGRDRPVTPFIRRTLSVCGVRPVWRIAVNRSSCRSAHGGCTTHFARRVAQPFRWLGGIAARGLSCSVRGATSVDSDVTRQDRPLVAMRSSHRNGWTTPESAKCVVHSAHGRNRKKAHLYGGSRFRYHSPPLYVGGPAQSCAGWPFSRRDEALLRPTLVFTAPGATGPRTAHVASQALRWRSALQTRWPCCLLAIWLLAAAAEAQQPSGFSAPRTLRNDDDLPIAAVRVMGTDAAEAAELSRGLHMQLGQLPSRERLQDDIESLLATGRFARVSHRWERSDSGWILSYILERTAESINASGPVESPPVFPDAPPRRFGFALFRGQSEPLPEEPKGPPRRLVLPDDQLDLPSPDNHPHANSPLALDAHRRRQRRRQRDHRDRRNLQAHQGAAGPHGHAGNDQIRRRRPRSHPLVCLGGTKIGHTKDGLVLTYRVLERPIVRRVEYRGTKKIKQAKLESLTNLKIAARMT